MRLLLPTALAVVLMAGSGNSLRADPDRYLCISENSAGVHYFQQTKTWGAQIFGPGQKYILRRLTGDERNAKYPSDTSADGTYFSGQLQEKDKSEWGLFSFGEKVPRATCDASFHCTTQSTFLTLHFSPATGRFKPSQLSGYYYQLKPTDKPFPDPEGEKFRQSAMNQPDGGFIEIGTCSAF
jgi:hypothetical protein